MIRWSAFLLVLLAFLGGQFGHAQNSSQLSAAEQAERDRLFAAGYPVLDVSGRLTAEQREALLLELSNLRACCDLDLGLLFQDQPLTGDAAGDLGRLQEQLQRTDLWTSRSALLLIQRDPPRVRLLRPADLRADTAPLTPTILDELSSIAATEGIFTGLRGVFADLDRAAEAQTNAPRPSRDWSLSPQVQSALFHFSALSLTLIFGGLLLHFRLPTVPGLSAAYLRPLRPRRGFGKAYGQASKKLARQAPGTPGLFFAHQTRRRRQVWLLFVLAALTGGLGFLALEVGGLASATDMGGLVLLAQIWMLRALISILLFVGSFGLLIGTPLGAWITPPAARRRKLAQDLARALPQQSGFAFVWQSHRRRLEIWQLGDLPYRAELLTVPLDRLQEDLTHGLHDEALQGFVAQWDRLGRTYAGEGEPGEIRSLQL